MISIVFRHCVRSYRMGMTNVIRKRTISDYESHFVLKYSHVCLPLVNHICDKFGFLLMKERDMQQREEERKRTKCVRLIISIPSSNIQNKR